jgi:Right handed beta helix region
MNIDSVTAYNWRSFPAFAVMALALIGRASPTLAATYYVDSTSGSDSASGRSESQAWKTLGKVSSSHFQPGDQILLARGQVWQEQLTVSSSGAQGTPIVFGAYGSGSQPLIDAQSTRNRGVSVVGKSYITLNDIAIQNSTSYSIEIFNSPHVTVANCTVRDSKGSAISVGGVSPDVQVDGCHYSQDPGFTINGGFVNIFSPVESAIVSHNTVSGFTGRMAIAFFDVNNAQAYGNNIDGGGIGIAINACSRNLTGGQIHDNVISNISTGPGDDGEAIELTGHVGAPNPHCDQDKAHPFPVFTVSAEIYNNKIYGGTSTFGGIDGWHAVDSRVHDNEIVHMKKYGMQWTAASDDNEFFRNTIRDSGQAGIAIYAGNGSSSARIHHNMIEGAPVAISGDSAAKIDEDYNNVTGVRSARSTSIRPGAHTTNAGASDR